MAIEIEVEGKSIVELRKQLKQLRNDLANATDPKEMERLAIAAGATKDRISDINKEIAIFEGDTKFEQAGTALGQVKNALMNLNFQEASEKAKVLSNVISSMTFSEATKGLSQLGSTFLNLGKALLTNPLFLIPAAITAILAATGLLGPALDGLKSIFSALGDVVEEFLKYLGLSTKEAEKLAAQKKKLTEETNKERQAIASESKEFAILIGKLKLTNANSKERDKLIKDINKEYGLTLQNLKDEGKFQEQLNGELATYIAFQRVKYQIQKNEGKVQLNLEKQDELQSNINKSKKEEQRLENELKKAEEDRAKGKYTRGSGGVSGIGQINTDVEKLTKSLNAVKNETKEFETQLDTVKKREEGYYSNLLDLEKEIERLRKLGKGYAGEPGDSAGKIKELEDLTKVITEEQRKLDSFQAITLEQQNELKRKQLKEDTEKRIKDIQDSTATETQKAEAIKLINENLLNELDMVDADYKEKIKKREEEKIRIDKENRDNDIAETERKLKEQTDAKIASLKLASLLDEDNLDKKKALLDAEMKAEIDATKAMGDEKALIELEYRKQKEDLDKEAAEKEKAQRQSVLDFWTNSTASTFAMVGDLAKTFAKDNEDSQKRAFNVNKAAGIAQAGIQTYQAAQGAYASQMALATPDAPIRAKVAAAVAIATGLANIAKIASTKFGGGKPSGGSTPSGGDRSSTPNFNLFGQANGGNTVNASPQQNQQNQPQQMVVKAVVVESDVTSTINRVARYRNLSEL